MPDLHVERLGDGPRVLFVHGSIMGGTATWDTQYPLADRWTLLVLSRRGFGESPPSPYEDFEADARDIAEALGEGAHLVAHSYGGVGAMYAAALRPEAVRSLTLVEPVAYSVALHDEAVRRCSEDLEKFINGAHASTRDLLHGFLQVMGVQAKLPDPLPPDTEKATLLMVRCRFPWTGSPPLEKLAHASFRKLVISGGHSPVFDSICDVLTNRLGAERAVIPGAGHAIPRTGKPFNDRLERFLLAAERSSA
ncbi:MAG: alpha/beta fold hydrolase [Syntrophobacteraceae bacterium]